MSGASRAKGRAGGGTEGVQDGLQIAQHDLRTVRVDLGSVRFLLRYGFSFDGHERLPESVTVSGTEVTAFFLTSTVHDSIESEEGGFRVSRRWSIMQAGRVRLALTVDVPEAMRLPRRGGSSPPARTFHFLFPGVASGERAGEKPCVYRGERTSLPACVLLSAVDAEICMLAEAGGGAELPSVALERGADEGGAAVRVMFETPPRDGRETPARSRGIGHDVDPGDGTQTEIQETGKLERELAIHVVVAPPGAAYQAAFGGVAARRPVSGESRKWALREEVRSFLHAHLVDEGGVCGLRTEPGSDLLSSSAGAALAVLLLRLHLGDDGMLELAQRLADFCMTGQHPGGLFYERWSMRERTWLGLRRSAPRGGTPLLSIEESSRVAASLLDFGSMLDRLGPGATRHALAGRRMVDAFIDSHGKLTPPGAVMTPDGARIAESGLGAVRFLHPLFRVADRDGRERYRKAAVALVADFLDLDPGAAELPISREGREPDAGAPVLLAEAALEAASRRIRIPDASALAGRLLPWLRLTEAPSASALPPIGAFVDSFVRPRLRPRPCQIAVICRRLSTLCRGPVAALLADHSRASLAAAGALPLGTSFVARVRWGVDSGAGSAPRELRKGEQAEGIVVGPVDARDFVTELGYALDLEEEGVW